MEKLAQTKIIEKRIKEKHRLTENMAEIVEHTSASEVQSMANKSFNDDDRKALEAMKSSIISTQSNNLDELYIRPLESPSNMAQKHRNRTSS